MKGKYRGKRLDNRMWVEGHYFVTPLTAEFNVKPENGAFFASGDEPIRHCIAANCVAFEVDPVTVGFCVNAYDIAGRSIWEGDVLHTRNEFDEEANSEVYFGDGYFVIQPTDGELVSVFRAVNEHFGKVVGNIYDNPELLKSNETNN